MSARVPRASAAHAAHARSRLDAVLAAGMARLAVVATGAREQQQKRALAGEQSPKALELDNLGYSDLEELLEELTNQERPAARPLASKRQANRLPVPENAMEALAKFTDADVREIEKQLEPLPSEPAPPDDEFLAELLDDLLSKDDPPDTRAPTARAVTSVCAHC